MRENRERIRKKPIMSFLLCLSLCFFIGCGKNAENRETEANIEAYNKGKVVSQTESEMNSQEVILNKKQIELKNRKSFSIPGNGLVDLETFHPQSAKEISSMVELYAIPDYPYYNGHIRTQEDDVELLASRNLEQISDPVCLRYGIITKNAAIRSFPTSKTMTREGKSDDLDYLQESMFRIGDGVIMCHQTKDKKYSFVQGYQYRGWILTECIGFCDKEEMMEFLKKDPFIVVTDAILHVRNKRLRMGTILPVAKRTEEGYLVKFPERDEGGNLKLEEETLLKSSVSLGYLDYTEENLLDQAYKMIGQPYGWGDTDENMDCSSTMNAIFRVFGIEMPRNTSKFSLFDAKVTDLSSMRAEEKEEVIKRAGVGSLILFPGHVMMYVGEKNGKSEILHNVTGYSLDGGKAMAVMECRVTPMEIYSTDGIFYPELFTTLVEIE